MKVKIVLFVLVVLFALSNFALADVTFKTETNSTVKTGIYLVKSKAYTINYIQGNKMRKETASKVDVGNGFQKENTVEIIDLDKGVLYKLSPGKGEYQEFSYEELKDQFKGKKMPDKYYADIEVNVEKGKDKEIDDYYCGNYIVGIKTDPESSAMQRIDGNMDIWLAGDVPGLEQITGFNKKFSEAVGFYGGAGEMGFLMQSAGAARHSYYDVFQQLSQKLPPDLGFPVVSIYGFDLKMQPREKNSQKSISWETRQSIQQGNMAGAMGSFMSDYAKGKVEEEADKAMTRTAVETAKTRIDIKVRNLAIKETVLSESLFEVPEEYTKTEK